MMHRGFVILPFIIFPLIVMLRLKVFLPHTQSVPLKQIEFEPSFSFINAKKRWTTSGKRENLFNKSESLALAKELGFRFTYGIGSKTEVGEILKFLSRNYLRFNHPVRLSQHVFGNFNSHYQNVIYLFVSSAPFTECFFKSVQLFFRV